MPTVAEQIAQFAALTANATEGPWEVVCYEHADGDYPPESYGIITGRLGDQVATLNARERADHEGPISTIPADAAFIAATRTIVPALLDAVAAIQGLLDDAARRNSSQIRADAVRHILRTALTAPEDHG